MNPNESVVQAEVVTVKTVNELTHAEKEELNNLSKEIFGASSRWQKLINKGYSKLVTEEATELVPGEKEDDEPTMRKVQVPLKTANGALQYTTERHTTASVKEYMLDLKRQLEERKALIQKMIGERKAKQELEKKLNEEVSGSASR